MSPSVNSETFYGYDSQGQLTSVTVKEANGTTLSTPLTTNYTYDAAGNLVSESDPNGMTTAYTYDDENRMLTETVTENGTMPLFEQTYTYYDNGLKESDVENNYTSGTLSATIEYDWQYDNLGRLTQEQLKIDAGTASVTPYTDTISYDLDGNRVGMSHVAGGTTDSTTYSYNGDDQLTSQTDSQTGTATYAYDANGSLISATNNGTVVASYAYNVENEMVSATVNGVTSSDVYDDNGDRVEETVNGTSTYYLYDDNNPTGYDQVLEAKSSPTAAPSMSYILGLGIIGQANSSGAVSYLLVDGQHDTRALVNASGAVTATFNYDAFGNVLGVTYTPSSPPPTIFLYQQMMYDPASGLNFTESRQTPLGSSYWLERDPDGYGNKLNPITENQYLFDNANPLMFTDPTGHDGLADLLVSMGMDSVLGSILMPVFRPAINYFASAVAQAVLPQGVQSILAGNTSIAPDAIVFDLPGVSFSTGNKLGPFGLTGNGGFEWAVSPHNGNQALYWFSNVGISVGAGGAAITVGDSGIGAFWNGSDSEEFAGPAWNVYLPIAALPKTWLTTIKNILSSQVGQAAQSMQQNLSNYSGILGTAGSSAVSAAQSTAAAIISNLSNFSVNIYWWQDGNFGFSIDYRPFTFGDKENDSVAVSKSEDWQVAPGNDVNFE